MYRMDAQVGLKTIALNLFFYFLPAAALCHDFLLVDSVETQNAGLVNVMHLCMHASIYLTDYNLV